MRSLVILLMLISGSSQASDWKEQDLSVVASVTQNSTDFYFDRIAATNLAAQISSTQLYEGVGISGDFRLSQSLLSGINTGNKDSLSKTNYGLNLGTRLFLSPVSNVDAAFSVAQTTKVLNLKDARFQSSESPLITSDKSVASLAWQVGSVAELRSLSLQFRHLTEFQDLAIGNTLFRNDTKSDVGLTFTNRISEDTNLVVNLNHSINSIEFNTVENKPKITDALFGFLTDYFGNSSLEVLIGLSNRNSVQGEASADVLSWQLNNFVALSETSRLTLSTKRQLTSSPDPTYLDAQLSDLSINFEWQFLENWHLESTFQIAQLSFVDDTVADSNEFTNTVHWQINDYLTMSGSASYQDYDGDRDEFVHSGVNAQLSISWEFY